MVSIAKKANVSKGTLYVYFLTKEALFLDYAKHEIEQFFERLNFYLTQKVQSSGIENVTHALKQAYSDSEDMIRLLSILHNVLESNAGFEKALDFRQSLLPLLETAGQHCEQQLSFIPSGEGKRLLLTIHGISLGLHQLSNPSDTIKKVEQQANMSLYQFDFKTALLTTVDLLLAGMEVRASKKTHK